MDSPLYDVYLTGKLTDNTTATQAAARLAALFKSTPDVMTGMLTGKPQLLKRGLDKNAALKYREALAAAGVEVAFKTQIGTVAVPVEPLPAPTTTDTPTLSLAPIGSDVLQESEREHHASPAIDTSALQLAPLSPLPAAATIAAMAPNISHLSLAAAGGELLSDAERQHPPIVTPDIGDLSLAPAGTPLETLASANPPVHPDLSGLSLAPPGTELLSAEQRNKSAPAPPNTDHIKLAN